RVDAARGVVEAPLDGAARTAGALAQLRRERRFAQGLGHRHELGERGGPDAGVGERGAAASEPAWLGPAVAAARALEQVIAVRVRPEAEPVRREDARPLLAEQAQVAGPRRVARREQQVERGGINGAVMRDAAGRALAWDLARGVLVLAEEAEHLGGGIELPGRERAERRPRRIAAGVPDVAGPAVVASG